MRNKQTKAANIVSSAVIGMDFVTVVVNGKAYVIMPPTIAKLAGAGYYFSLLGEGETIKDVLMTLGTVENAANVLSMLIAGDTSHTVELSKGTFEEIVSAIDEGLSLINVESFMRLLALRKSVLMLTAKPKQ